LAKSAESRILVSFSLSREDEWILKSINRLALMEYGRKGRSKIIKKALIEYLERHKPGNPQTTLTDPIPTDQEQARLEAGVRYLKAKCRLSIRQIARITGWGRGRIQRIVKGIDVKPYRVKKEKFDVNAWRQRWIFFRRGAPLEEAFKW